MIKIDELVSPTSCLNKAGDDEPIFVLRAKDPLAAEVVRFWADKATTSGQHESSKIMEAQGLAAQMETWRLGRHP